MASADLIVDRVYKGGPRVLGAGADPIHRLLTVANMGGFRPRIIGGHVRLLVLYTSRVEPDWPDILDEPTGDFAYYGDNRTPGAELLDKRGNRLLQRIFALSHGTPEDRKMVPPIFLFEKADEGRDVRFRGLLVPGSKRLSAEEELVAIWRTTREKRFQNYRAHFSVLDEAVIARSWIDSVLAGEPGYGDAPRTWRHWVRARLYTPLEAPKTTTVRSKNEQLPATRHDSEILHAVYDYFSEDPVRFEHFAAELFKNSDNRVTHVDVTRPTRDGGRDGLGEYKIGLASDPIRLEFALEAKCYKPGKTSAGVKNVSRLISRIKHREFGVFVTTSFVGAQAYEEIRADEHPIVIIAGRDIVDALKQQGYRTTNEVLFFLRQTFPHESIELTEQVSSARRADASFEQRSMGLGEDVADGAGARPRPDQSTAFGA